MYLKALLHDKKCCVRLKWLSGLDQLKIKVRDELRQSFVHFKLGKVSTNAKMATSTELYESHQYHSGGFIASNT
jgi:hypothetical protein